MSNYTGAFVRIHIDLPREVAEKMHDAAIAQGKTKKQFVSDAIIAACASNASPVNRSNKRK